MYRIPDDLNLSPVVGEMTTQIRVGQGDLQFTFGPVHFAVWSPVTLLRADAPETQWEPGQWPAPLFFEIMNSTVLRCDAVSDRRIEFEFANGLMMHLEDSSDHYECIEIWHDGQTSTWVI